MGWSSGMADQLSLPSMGALREARSRTGRKLLCHDHSIQSRLDRPVGMGLVVPALRQERAIAGLVQPRPSPANGLDPSLELIRRDGGHGEMHSGKAVAAEVGGLAEIFAGFVGHQVKLIRHPV